MCVLFGWLVLLCVVCRCGSLWSWLWSWCCVVWHAEKPRVSIQNAPVCTFKTSPCVPAPRAHVFQHVRVVPAYTRTFCMYARRVCGQEEEDETRRDEALSLEIREVVRSLHIKAQTTNNRLNGNSTCRKSSRIRRIQLKVTVSFFASTTLIISCELLENKSTEVFRMTAFQK